MKVFYCVVALLAAANGSSASNKICFVHTYPKQQLKPTTLSMNRSAGAREEEIRKKIEELKNQGKIKSNSSTPTEPEFDPTVTPSGNESLDRMRKARKEMRLGKSAVDDYADRLGAKLGRKSRALGMNLPTASSKIVSGTDKEAGSRQPRLGSLDADDWEELEEEDYGDEEFQTDGQLRQQLEIGSEMAQDAIDMLRRNVNEEEDEDEMSEDDLMDAVSQALSETNFKTSRERFLEEDSTLKPPPISIATSTVSTTTVGAAPTKTTSGVGGSWAPPQGQTDEYKPSKSGTWGVFPRPKSISQAYGGGRKVGAGVTTVDTDREKNTQDLLKAYRERIGIEVQSEKDNKEIIEEAIALAGRAMQRGSYSVGISALEKVTQHCSAKSELGGDVFLNLAMLYEAEGRTDQALSLYATLTKNPFEKIKANADKLLYGLEAMQFMRKEAKLKDFSRKKVKETFIDATGFKDMSSKFDDVYNTAYLDLEKGQYYRILTENVVRSTREARQVLLKAVASGEVERLKVVQALRSISRHFDDALEEEKKKEESKNIPVDYAGRPIVGARRNSGSETVSSVDGYILSEPTQTLENLDGKWRLQLMADRKGDGVDYFFNTTLISQKIDTADMVYESNSQGLRSISQSGSLIFDAENRILAREGAKAFTGDNGGGGGVFGMFGGNKSGRGVKMSNIPQQVLSVDSVLLVTRAIVKVSAADNVKDFYSVWRRDEANPLS